MRRSFITTLAATLVFGYGSASAQDGSLAGVTMRVVDDISDLDAVVLELDAGRGEDADGAEADGRDDGAASATLRSASARRMLDDVRSELTSPPTTSAAKAALRTTTSSARAARPGPRPAAAPLRAAFERLQMRVATAHVAERVVGDVDLDEAVGDARLAHRGEHRREVDRAGARRDELCAAECRSRSKGCSPSGDTR